jgi:predicted nucleic acid-binding protein
MHPKCGCVKSVVALLSLCAEPRISGKLSSSDRLIEIYEEIPVNDVIGRYAYGLLKAYAKSHGLRTFDSLIAATAIQERRTLVTKNRKHFEMIDGLTIDIPEY